MLTVRNDLPPELLRVAAQDLLGLLGGPTLFHLRGAAEPALFLSVLLHGNETTGLLAAQELLRRYQGRTLPRSLSLFVGNVAAAHSGQRYLPGQADYNRIWYPGRDEEHDMTQEVLAEMRQRGVFASIDVHNNTGRNPHYAIVARYHPRHLNLARRFSRTVVYATYPDTTCTYAFAALGPAITVEAGVPGTTSGTHHVADFLDQCLQLVAIEDSLLNEDVDLFHTVAVVKVPRDCSYGFEGDDADLQLVSDIDRFNFRELEPGTRIARVRSGVKVCLDIRQAGDDERVFDYFTLEQGELRVARRVMPAMLTKDRDIIRMDCLCYLMERMQQPAMTDP